MILLSNRSANTDPQLPEAASPRMLPPTLSVMNPRRVHELMRAHFPAFNAVEHEWMNMHDGDAPRVKELGYLLKKTILGAEVVIEVHRKLGALLPLEDAAAYIGSHIGEGMIRVADRQFTSFLVVEVNGVATGWRKTDNPSAQGRPPAASPGLQR